MRKLKAKLIKQLRFCAYAVVATLAVLGGVAVFLLRNLDFRKRDKVCGKLYPTEEDRQIKTHAGLIQLDEYTQGSATGIKDEWEEWPESQKGFMGHDEGYENGFVLHDLKGLVAIMCREGCDLAMLEQCVYGAMVDHRNRMEAGSKHDPEHIKTSGVMLAKRAILVSVAYLVVCKLGPAFRRAFGDHRE